MKSQHKDDTPKTRAEVMHDNWQVMKPFVHFGFKAMMVIGSALISIIKLLPLLKENKDHKKEGKIIKI